MASSLIVLAVSKMRTGVCLAGVDPVTGQWVRPVKEFGPITVSDITYPDGAPIQPFDRVQLGLLPAGQPAPPHIEDRVCNFVRHRPVREGVVAEEARAMELKRWSAADATSLLQRCERSLALLPVDAFELLIEVDEPTGKVDIRARLPGVEGCDAPAPVTDLRVRALARSGRLGARATEETLARQFGVREWFVVLSLSRLHLGRHWPLVAALHAVPSIEATIDYSRL